MAASFTPPYGNAVSAANGLKHTWRTTVSVGSERGDPDVFSPNERPLSEGQQRTSIDRRSASSQDPYDGTEAFSGTETS